MALDAELIEATKQENKKKQLIIWRKEVLERDHHKCVNCTRTYNVAPVFIIPPEVGGNIITSNGVTLCRKCLLAADSARNLPQKINDRTAINFYISRGLFNQLNKFVKDTSFNNISELVRHMVNKFIDDPSLFRDLDSWQDEGADVKINSLIDGSRYQLFKSQCILMNKTFTEVFKGLLRVAVDSNNPELINYQDNKDSN